MSDGFGHGRRNREAVEAWKRKAGTHNPGSKRPEKDVFDHINEYTDEECEELVSRLPHAFVGDHVRIVDGGTHHMEQGRVVSRVGGKLGVVFAWDTAMAPKFYDPMHLEIISDR